MTFASYIRRERMLSMRKFLAGKLSLAPRSTGRPLAGENCLQITTRFRFLVYSALFFFIFFFAQIYNEHAVRGKKKHLVHRGGKRFFVIV